MTGAGLYFGTVMHQRLRPRRHGFTYPVYFLRVPIDAIDDLRRPFFSVDRFNLFSFHSQDHGPRDGSPLGPWIRDVLAQHGLAVRNIELQTYPRVRATSSIRSAYDLSNAFYDLWLDPGMTYSSGLFDG